MTDLQKVYSHIPSKYELVNRLITLGMDSWWRKSMVDIAKTAPAGRWLDMCCGTGETALLLQTLKPTQTDILAADYSQQMIGQFRTKSAAKTIPITRANAFCMPFADNTFQLITTSFATRNLHQSPEHLEQAFSEFYRVLKPTGRYVSIETTRPAPLPVDILFRGIVKLTVEPVGRLVSGSSEGYRYLSKSIRTFYSPHQLETFLNKAGFTDVSWRRLFPGAVAIHTAMKI